MKVAILTLPFRTNYGQILQGYALQTILERMGHDVEMLDDPYFTKAYYLRYPMMCLKRGYQKLVQGKKEIEVFVPEHVRIKQHTQRFIDRHIRRRIVCNWDAAIAADYDAFVVGSDQVWRPQYFVNRNRPCVELAFLSFAAENPVKRISYAASFGTDQMEYTPSQLHVCSQHLKKFNAVSVREESGVLLCDEYFGVKAEHVLDPTMLLRKEDYVGLIPQDISPVEGNMLVYILDESDSTRRFISDISQNKGLKPFRVNAQNGDNVPLADRIQPPVEKWLQGFADAEFVITDSFHACVFSIIFHKPFICVGNKQRGMTRIESLLNMIGLKYKFQEFELLYVQCDNVEWEKVDAALEERLSFSLNFLKEALE